MIQEKLSPGSITEHYVAVSYLGAVEVPQDKQFSTSDNLEKIFEQYKDKRAKFWNIRSGKCKSFF
ncbi:hypothetical protein C9426_34075 [Serratia sp. S1B]|nr:hypothetical protein C9426_34075 [Serratia sp. S1B]